MSDNAFKQSQFKVPGAIKQTTDNASNHNGGNIYYQMPTPGGFNVMPRIDGHTQKHNIIIPTDLRGPLNTNK